MAQFVETKNLSSGKIISGSDLYFAAKYSRDELFMLIGLSMRIILISMSYLRFRKFHDSDIIFLEKNFDGERIQQQF